MRLEDYNTAKRLQDSIEEFDKMEAALKSAVHDVKSQHNKSDADDLSHLILKLVETKKGERVLDYIVGIVTQTFQDAKSELQKRFEELWLMYNW